MHALLPLGLNCNFEEAYHFVLDNVISRPPLCKELNWLAKSQQASLPEQWEAKTDLADIKPMHEGIGGKSALISCPYLNLKIQLQDVYFNAFKEFMFLILPKLIWIKS